MPSGRKCLLAEFSSLGFFTEGVKGMINIPPGAVNYILEEMKMNRFISLDTFPFHHFGIVIWILPYSSLDIYNRFFDMGSIRS